ncbi:hypothetical protein FSARC_13873 [Fusarium sarcochroum]|uniref:Apple domain-containing protein n=1 Tax=Fusarium sarcochroum TaxID=1208366 RepID=A0A8H4SY96_9HYPO|nr:hypothetical protein FSARC_13873 [Fusarium sarcochroum]
MKTSIAILSASVASAMASPFSISTKQCNIAPSAAVNGKVHPYHNGKADTAIDCQTYCASDDACKSFAFGLVKGAHQPSCLLFEVSAAKVPARKDGLHVFDKECAADRVPTSAPTTAQPWGTVPKKALVRRATQCNCAASGSASNNVQPFKTTTAATAKDCQALAEADTSCMSFLYGLSDDSKSPVCKLYKVAASKIPARGDSLFVFDKGCSSKQVPTTAPTEDAPRGLVSVVSKGTKVAQPKATKATKAEDKKTEHEGDYEVTNAKPKTTKAQNPKPKATKAIKADEEKVEYKQVSKPKSTKVQNAKPKATKVSKGEGNKVQYVEPKATEHAQNSKPKSTKAAKVENYVEPTKVSNPKAKATKVTKVNNSNEDQDTKFEDTKAENNKQAKVTKVQNQKHQATKAVKPQEHQATKVAEVESNKDTKAKDTKNKDTKVESPKTLVTKIRNNEQQATQASKAEGKKSDCKTTKVSNAQPKVTQAY